jgi:hypothetical protein
VDVSLSNKCCCSTHCAAAHCSTTVLLTTAVMLCSLHYGAQLETSTYQHNTADYVYMYLFGMMSLNVRSG